MKTMKRSAKHLAFIRTLPCAKTLVPGNVQAAHIRRGTDGGVSLKPSDCWVLPLSAAEHARQHQIGEPAFYNSLDAARGLALMLWEHTGDTITCKRIIIENRKEVFYG